MLLTTSTVATCLAREVDRESGMIYGAPWKKPNLSTPQAFFARKKSSWTNDGAIFFIFTVEIY